MGKTLIAYIDIPRLDSMEFTCFHAVMQRYTSMVNTWSPQKLAKGISPISITGHAIERCQQRVASALTRDEVIELLCTMVSAGRTRTTPRKWTKRSVSPAPGLRFLYWAELPDVCGLVVGRTLVTVLTRDSCGTGRLSDRHRPTSGLHKRRQRHTDQERFLRGPVEDAA